MSKKPHFPDFFLFFAYSMENNVISEKSKRRANESLSQLKLSSGKTNGSCEDELVAIESAKNDNLSNCQTNGTSANGNSSINSNDDLGLSSLRKFASFVDTDNNDEAEDFAKMISCFALLMPSRPPAVTAGPHNASSASSSSGSSNGSNGSHSRHDLMMTAAAAANAFGLSGGAHQKNKNNDISSVTPGAFSFVTQMHNPKPLSEHLTLDLDELKKQYKKLKVNTCRAFFSFYLIIIICPTKFKVTYEGCRLTLYSY